MKQLLRLFLLIIIFTLISSVDAVENNQDKLDILILSTGDIDWADTVKMIVGEELGKKENFHILDINQIPYFKSRYNYGIDGFEFEEFGKPPDAIETVPYPHIIVKADIKTLTTRRLQYYGRFRTQFNTKVSLVALFISNSHVIAGPLVKNVKFSELNIFENLSSAVVPMANTLSKQIELFANSKKGREGVD